MAIRITTTMAPDYDGSIASQAALELVLNGDHASNDYTEPVLRSRARVFGVAER